MTKTNININYLNKSSEDLIYLLNRNYPKKAAINLIGNKFNLNKLERYILHKAVFANKVNVKRKNKILDIQQLPKKNIYIDTYNLFITIKAALIDDIFFHTTDGFIRDAMKITSGTKINKHLPNIVKIMSKFLHDFNPGSCTFILDEAKSKSRQTADFMNENIEFNYFNVELCKNADKFLFDKEYVVTSDGIIIENSFHVFNVAFYILTKYLKKRIISFL